MRIPEEYRKAVEQKINQMADKYAVYSLTNQDVIDAIQSACQFFGIPMPRTILDMTGLPGGRTMFLNRDKESLYDDEICFNMDQLVELNIRSKDAFSLAMTHECAHRYFQNHTFEGKNNGAWESELCADFYMGARAFLCGMDVSMVSVGMYLTGRSRSHPEGALRSVFISGGKVAAYELLQEKGQATIPDLFEKFNEFLKIEQKDLAYLQQHL